MRLTIEGARVIDPASQFDEITDLHIAAGHILASSHHNEILEQLGEALEEA